VSSAGPTQHRHWKSCRHRVGLFHVPKLQDVTFRQSGRSAQGTAGLGGTLRERGSASLIPRRHLITRNAGIPLIRTMCCASLRIACLVSSLDIRWRIVSCRWIRCRVLAARCVRHRAPS
jgi:hypothetical protein